MPNRFSRKNFVVLALLIIAVVAFWYAPAAQDVFYSFTTVLQKLVGEHTAMGVLSFVLLAALSAMVAPFSSIPLVPAAILIWGKWLAFALLLSGWVLGGVITYFLGAFAAYPAVRFFVSKSNQIEYWCHKIRVKATFIIVFLFRMALPAEIPGYILGFTHYDFWKYILATALAEAPFAAIVVFASGALVAEKQASFMSWLLVIVVIIIMSSVALRVGMFVGQNDDRLPPR